MSTFDGFVAEFPDIRIDRFRDATLTRPAPDSPQEQSTRRPPALAFLLSHAHSDHLVGLQSCRSAFIYCSAATREIVLRLERRSHRLMFAPGGVLVAEKGAKALQRQGREYARLAGQLKPLPLDTPVTIELAPGRTIQVTLFSANHCAGAVMFLIEGRDAGSERRAVLYTGDVRAEDWWVASLMRHPVLLPYVHTSGRRPLQRLDAVYLDTTFASKDDPYRAFQSKADGIAELLAAVAKYPSGTKFYFDAWTFGYEEVWLALAHFLGTRVHVDRYKYELYAGLLTESKEGLRAPEAFQLIRAYCGNHPQPGCLTMRVEDAKIHSCEKGTDCEIFSQGGSCSICQPIHRHSHRLTQKHSDFVRVTPIISRHRGQEMPELGAGGGHSDLSTTRLELDLENKAAVDELVVKCQSHFAEKEPRILEAIVAMLLAPGTLPTDRCVVLDGADYGHRDPNSLTVDDIVAALAQKVRREHASLENTIIEPRFSREDRSAPKRITFPYSRHSSYAELCGLIAAFQPRDIVPCVVEGRGWTMVRSMGFLFGHLYHEPIRCSHDLLMLRKTKTGNPIAVRDDLAPERVIPENHRKRKATDNAENQINTCRVKSFTRQDRPSSRESHRVADRPPGTEPQRERIARSPQSSSRSPPSVVSPDGTAADVEIALRREACQAAAGIGSSWFDVHLVSLNGHDDSSQEL